MAATWCGYGTLETVINSPPRPSPLTRHFKRLAHVAGGAKGELPDGLARVVEAWPTLPEPLRRAVLAMIDATG